MITKKKRSIVMLKFICYPKCTTCQKAKKWLDDNNIEYDIITKEHIREKNNIADASNIYFFRDAKNAVSKLLRHLKYV